MKLIRGLAVAIASMLALSACSDGKSAREILGLGRKSPDEFRVVARPPLSTPPDFQLRPPVEGEDRIALPPADTQAKALVIEGKDISDVTYDYRRKMGGADTAVGIVSSYSLDNKADSALLGRVNAEKADPNIREKIYQERTSETDEAKSNWLIPRTDGDPIVDAAKEKARLKAAADAGKPLNTGETPAVEQKQRGLLEKIF